MHFIEYAFIAGAALWTTFIFGGMLVVIVHDWWTNR